MAFERGSSSKMFKNDFSIDPENLKKFFNGVRNIFILDRIYKQKRWLLDGIALGPQCPNPRDRDFEHNCKKYWIFFEYLKNNLQFRL